MATLHCKSFSISSFDQAGEALGFADKAVALAQHPKKFHLFPITYA